MNTNFLRKAVLLGLMTGALGTAHAQSSEQVGAAVPAQGGAPSPYAVGERVPAGTILLDEYTGRFITDPTGGFGGAPASALQTSLGMTTIGAGAQVASNNWVAEDFTVPAQGWSITRARFYSYQTGSGTTSTINDIRVQVFSGTPTGTPVFGDTTTNRLTSTTFNGAYRVTDTTLTNNQRPIYEIVVDFAPAINLTTPGTYWIAWTMGGTGTSGPWAPPQTLVGQATTGNCQQSIGGAAFAALVDGGSATPLGCIFVLEGATLPVTLQNFSVD